LVHQAVNVLGVQKAPRETNNEIRPSPGIGWQNLHLSIKSARGFVIPSQMTSLTQLA